MKNYTSLLLILICAFSLFIYGNGTVRAPKEPIIIQGLQLDTPKAKIQKKLDFSKAENFDSTGNTYKFLSPAENIDSMYLTFYKDQLQSIWINYSKETTQLSLSDFRKNTEENYGLPANWKIDQERTGESATQTYDGVIVTISGNDGKYSVHFTSTAVVSRQAADIPAEEDTKKKASKP